MPDVDLIPEDYRQSMRLQRFTKSFVIAFGSVILLVALSKGVLNWLVATEKSATESLEADKFTVVAQRAELEKIRARQADLQERVVLLDSLQGGAPAEHIFAIINQALNESVWFTGLKFRRTTEDLAAPLTSNTAASIRNGQQDQDRSRQHVPGRMRMEISGQALNHSALAELVKRFLAQQDIEDVHIVNTSTLHYPAGQVVAYNLVVIINSQEQRHS